ncbi:hypothetical protein [Streptomyces sp. NPDC002187]|uniref:hypothetical protein n=1 Tax=Streptomyces sp. NPDC002187 TaxID=3364637 RepID=UPI0036C654A5
MTLTRSTLLLTLLTLALLLSLAAATAAAALARWDGATVPASITRAGVAFAGTMSLCLGLIALVRTALP